MVSWCHGGHNVCKMTLGRHASADQHWLAQDGFFLAWPHGYLREPSRSLRERAHLPDECRQLHNSFCIDGSVLLQRRSSSRVRYPCGSMSMHFQAGFHTVQCGYVNANPYQRRKYCSGRLPESSTAKGTLSILPTEIIKSLPLTVSLTGSSLSRDIS